MDPPACATRTSIFISYSRKDELIKDRLVLQLRVLEMQQVFDVWDDSRILEGEPWLDAIRTELARCQVAIFLISVDFLNSSFISSEEVPKLLRGARERGVIIYPLLVGGCAWQQVDWLSEIQVKTYHGHPAPAGRKRDEFFAEVAKEIGKRLRSAVSKKEKTTIHDVWKRRKRIVTAVFIAALAVGVGVALYMFTRVQVFTGSWQDFIRRGGSGRWEQRYNWDVPDTWGEIKGVMNNPDDLAVLVRGTQWGVASQRLLYGRVLKDFEMEFTVRLLKGSSAAWILRANPEKKNGYLFRLQKEGSVLCMRGFIVRNGRETEFDTGTTRVVSRPGCCREDDVFRIEGTVHGYEFDFKVSLQNPKGDDEGEPFTARFVDNNKSFRYGNVGLTGADEHSETAVEIWLVIAG